MALINLTIKPSALINKSNKNNGSLKFQYDTRFDIYKDLIFLSATNTHMKLSSGVRENQYYLINANNNDHMMMFDVSRPNEICLLNPWNFISQSRYMQFFPFFKELTGLEYIRDAQLNPYGGVAVLYNGTWHQFGRENEMWLKIDDIKDKPLLTNRFTFKGVSNE